MVAVRCRAAADVGYGLHLPHLENPEIGFPPVEFEQRIVVAAQVAGQSSGVGDDLIEHTADRGSIEHACVYGETDDSPRERIYHHHYPVCSQEQRFTAKEIETPDTSLCVAEEREPGGVIRVRLRAVALSQHATDDVLDEK